jgi:hypothetical protein
MDDSIKRDIKIFEYGNVNWIKLVQILVNTIPKCPRTLLEGMINSTIKFWINDGKAQT